MLQLEENLLKKIDDNFVSWEPGRRRPNYLSTKIWHMIQSNNPSEILEGDFTEILEKTFLLGWTENKKSIRCWVEKEEEESSQRWSGSAGTSLAELAGLVVWSLVFDGKCCGSGCRMDLVGRDAQAAGPFAGGLRYLGLTIKFWIRLVTKPGPK